MIVRIGEGDCANVDLLGLKGAGLCEIARLGLSTPPGFIITADVCREFYELGRTMPAWLPAEIRAGIERLEAETGRTYASGPKPLLVSVRSGAAIPMPGMMDTLLNLGLTGATFEALLAETGDEKFAWDCRCRFVRMYGQIVLGIDGRLFDQALHIHFERSDAGSINELSAEQLRKLHDNFLTLVDKSNKGKIPDDPFKQMETAVEAVFLSWNSPRARVFRNLRRGPEADGTAVVVQAMVYGNRGTNSGAGTATTRDPIMGSKRLFLEFLADSQGEEIREGMRAPMSAADLKAEMPGAYNELVAAADALEKKYRSVQEIEVTVEDGKLYLLQTRPADCTTQATIKSSADMVAEGLLTRNDVLLRIDPESLRQILHRYIDPNVQVRNLVRGVAVSPGAASGLVAFSTKEVLALKEQHKEAILVRPDTRMEDAEGVEAADGILLSRGSRTSHAAVAARRMGKPCVAGCSGMMIDLENRKFTVGNSTVKAGDVITIDGGTGRVFSGTVPMVKTTISDEFRELLSWADEARTLRVYANADTPEDVKRAIEFGAEGIGLARTESMFMAGDRLPLMQTLVLADDEAEQKKMLAKLQRIQREDFIEIFRYLNGRPSVFRLLDPPLHEFIPDVEPLMSDVYDMRSHFASGEAAQLKEILLRKVLSHREVNPMLGLRGVRLAILRPEIVRMQVSSVFEAACEVSDEGSEVRPSIMVPLVGHVNEFRRIRAIIDESAQTVMEKRRRTIEYRVGVLIEVPRAALIAADLARVADFFSFGTNDLTQTTFGLSRDDSEHKFLINYLNQRILDANPFEVLDRDGVARLIRIAVDDGRAAKPDLEFGLCGEHGADPDTISFCHELGIHYVSCSPYQVPIARLAAAQARIRSEKD